MAITKELFEMLPESDRAHFKANGDSYELTVEDVEGLKQSKAQILAEKKALQAEADALKAFKAEYEQKQNQTQEEKLKEAGAFAELEKKLRAKIEETEQAKQAELNQIRQTLTRERLINELTKRGVLADRAKYALADIADKVELSADFTALKVKDGIGDAKEFDGLVATLREQTPFLFESSLSPGSGATGSNGNGGGQGKTWTRQQWESADTATRVAFTTNGGKVI